MPGNYEMFTEKRMNIEHRTSNIECWMGKYEDSDLCPNLDEPVLTIEKWILNVGAASSREINYRGWKPLPQKVYLMETWTFQISS